METSHGVRLEVEFESETANMSRELELEATFARLVEFTDSSGMLTSSSTVLQTVDLAQLSYSRVSTNQVTVGGVQGYELATQGVQGNFTFKVVAYAFLTSVNINSTSLPVRVEDSSLHRQLSLQAGRLIACSPSEHRV